MKIEGRNAVLELLKSDRAVDKILMEKDAGGSLGRIFAMAREKGIRVQFLDKAALDRVSAEKRHQGVVAYTTDYEYADFFSLFETGKDAGLLVLCDGIEDVHNLGSILRVAECAGADGVIIPKAKGASVTEAVVRISAGAAEHIKVAKVPSINYAIDEIKKHGYWIYALEADGESIFKVNFPEKVALVIGGEDSGVKRLTKEKSDMVVSLPLMGQVNSLNASVALGVAVYEVLRGRLQS